MQMHTQGLLHQSGGAHHAVNAAPVVSADVPGTPQVGAASQGNTSVEVPQPTNKKQDPAHKTGDKPARKRKSRAAGEKGADGIAVAAVARVQAHLKPTLTPEQMRQSAAETATKDLRSKASSLATQFDKVIQAVTSSKELHSQCEQVEEAMAKLDRLTQPPVQVKPEIDQSPKIKKEIEQSIARAEVLAQDVRLAQHKLDAANKALQESIAVAAAVSLSTNQATIKEHQPQKPKRLSAQACDVAAYFFSPRRKRSQISLAAPA